MFSQSADELYRKHVEDFQPAEDQRHCLPRGQQSLRSSSFQPPKAFPPIEVCSAEPLCPENIDRTWRLGAFQK